MGEIKLFEKEEFGKLRVILCNGEPWFVARDVCAVLGTETRDLPDILEHDEQRPIVDIIHTLNDSTGLRRDSRIISEPGLYSLILRSRKPEAKAFKRWVTHEVLPSIRKTGAYATNNALTMPNFSNPAEAARAWADEYEAKQRSALILLKRMRKPPFLDRFGGFALSRGCPDPELIAVSAGSFNEANVLEPHRR